MSCHVGKPSKKTGPTSPRLDRVTSETVRPADVFSQRLTTVLEYSLVHLYHYPPGWKQAGSSFHDGSWCGGRVFSRVAQLILAVGHTRRYRSGRPLPVCCRHREIHLESISRTSSQSEFIEKPRLTHREPLRNGTFGFELHVGKSSKITGPTSPDLVYQPVKNAVEAYIVYQVLL